MTTTLAQRKLEVRIRRVKDTQGNLRCDIAMLAAEASGMPCFDSITLHPQHAVVMFKKPLQYPEARFYALRIDYCELESLHDASTALWRLRYASREVERA